MLTNPADPKRGAPLPSAAPESNGRANRTGVWVAGGIALTGCIVVGVIDPNNTNYLPACAFKAATGLDCPGCGMTRGLHALLRGNIPRAVDHNILLVTILAATAVYFGWNAIARRTGRKQFHFTFRRNTWIAIGLAVLSFWILRNLPWSPFDWLGSSA